MTGQIIFATAPYTPQHVLVRTSTTAKAAATLPLLLANNPELGPAAAQAHDQNRQTS